MLIRDSNYRIILEHLASRYEMHFLCHYLWVFSCLVTTFEPPNLKAKKFYNLLSKADEPLYKGCEKHSTLSAMSRMLSIMSDFNMSQSCYDRMVQTIKEFMPDSTLCPSYYESKKMVSKLGLGYEKINMCPNGCNLYYGKDLSWYECYMCGHPRYKPRQPGRAKRKNIPYKYMHYLPLTPRLQRLYISKDTTQHMTWHHENRIGESLVYCLTRPMERRGSILIKLILLLLRSKGMLG